MTSNLKSFGDLMKNRPAAPQKAPAYEWQDLALRVVKDLNVPGFKRASVFKVCKQYPKVVIEKALSDTKELCQTGEQWRYFFKVLDAITTENKA